MVVNEEMKMMRIKAAINSGRFLNRRSQRPISSAVKKLKKKRE